MAPDTPHSMDGTIQPGDVVVSHVNGTRTLYIIATVGSTVGDLTLHSISTMTGEDASIMRGYEQQTEDQAVWLFGGSAAAYVKAPPVEQVISRNGPTSATPESIVHTASQKKPFFTKACSYDLPQTEQTS